MDGAPAWQLVLLIIVAVVCRTVAYVFWYLPRNLCRRARGDRTAPLGFASHVLFGDHDN